jgi:hypothetical protein
MIEGRKYSYVKKRTSLVKAIKSFYSRLDEMEMELRDNSEHFYSLNILREGREIERVRVREGRDRESGGRVIEEGEKNRERVREIEKEERDSKRGERGRGDRDKYRDRERGKRVKERGERGYIHTHTYIYIYKYIYI